MQRASHIALIITLLTALLLLAGPRYAGAQNSPTAPYINSTQLYRVAMGNVANRVEWHLSNPNASPATRELGNTLSWADSGRVDKVSPTLDSAFIEIKFVESVFVNAGTIIDGPWELIYSEFDGNTCIARRSVAITPVENEFNLSVAAYAPDCNSYTGRVWNNNDTLTNADTTVVFLSVIMEKATDHLVREWSFSATVSLSAGYSLPADAAVFIPAGDRNGTSTSNGAFEITAVSGGSFTLSVTGLDPDDPAYGATGDVVEFQVQVIGPPASDANVTLTISSGQGVSGANYRVVTDENSTTDNEETRVLYGIPNTSIVSAN